MGSRGKLLFILSCAWSDVVWSYKLSNVPLNTTGPNAGNVSETEQKVNDLLFETLDGDMKDFKQLPDLEKKGEGMGTLGKSLEFLMLKVAQLETLAELQQVELGNQRVLIKKMHEKMDFDEAEVSMAQQGSEERVQEAHAVLKRVIQKHARQREDRKYHPEAQRAPSEAKEAEPEEEQEEGPGALLQKQEDGFNPIGWVSDVASAAVDSLDGTGLTGNALTDAYKEVKKQGTGKALEFVRNTDISTVEMAVAILTAGFDDWSADCDNVAPQLGLSGDALYIDFGHNACEISLMGQRTKLFDWNWGRQEVPLPILDMLPEPARTVFKTLAQAGIANINVQITMATGVSDCSNGDQPLALIECLGHKIITQVPPFNYLNRMSDILTEVIEVFAKIAGTVVEKAMEKGSSLVQTATTSKFPAAGEPRVQHHKGTNLVIESHTQHVRAELAAVQTNLARNAETGDPPPGGAVAYGLGDGKDVHTTRLITQFDGRETDTSSCLAFAPKSRSAGSGVSKGDWQVGNQGDFLQLEPWAVPCDNAWMKDNCSKWQGYSFYSGQLAIEKCVTVTFSLGMQPVVAFVGGLQFEILPKPLFQLGTTVCWPNHQPGGVDLSLLRSEVRSAGVLLFSRTLRLTKRFGAGPDFLRSNIRGGYSTFRKSLGIDKVKGESRWPMDSISREASLLETRGTGGTRGGSRGGTRGTANQSQGEAEAEVELSEEEVAAEAFQWRTQSEDFYLASLDISVNKTFEAYGEDAARHVGAGKESFELFSFKNPGLVDFKVQGLMAGNVLEMGIELGFGPYRSPARKIPLVDIADQFSIILAGMPFVSTRSKVKAIAALRDFSPGSVIALYSPHCHRFLNMNGGDGEGGLGLTPQMNGNGVADSWTWERFTVVDAGKGQIALHNRHHNRFLGTGHVRAHRNADDLPSEWTSERFTVVELGDGEVAFHNTASNRFLNMRAEGVGRSNHPPKPPQLPSNWGWERFRILPAERILVPGSSIALHSPRWNRFVVMTNGALERSVEKDVTDFPEEWTWERFTVVDAGGGQIALHNTFQNRFVGVGGTSAHRLVDQLPSDWTFEKFDVWPAGNGEVVLHNTAHNQMLRMSDHTVDASVHMDPKHLPDNWSMERFQVVQVKPYLQPGTTVALRCAVHGRFVKMYPGAPSALLLAMENKTQHDTVALSSFGPTNMIKEITDGAWEHWQEERDAERAAREAAWVREAAEEQARWEAEQQEAARQAAQRQFEEQEAARRAAEEAARKAALLGTIGRSVEMGEHDMPDWWTWERFTVVDAGNGQVAFHNSLHNRFLKMNGDRMQSSAPQAPDALPAGWSWERFTVLPAGHGQFMLHNSVHNRVVQMTNDNVAASPHMNPQDMPGEWTWERFQIVPVKPYLQPGTVVALHCGHHNRYITMKGASLERSAERGANGLPANWNLERFTVVDAGNGQIALHNAQNNRFVQMRAMGAMGASPPRAATDFPKAWTWERFTVVPAGHGEFAFHNTYHNRMIAMSDSTIAGSKVVAPQDLTSEWTWERFRIVQVSEASEKAQDVRATFD
ncbi:unnamed protein product [Symbiodinium sp. CCMP2592]|nr:unnamed protein product [Symbiodinium sp. CCMP2592]